MRFRLLLCRFKLVPPFYDTMDRSQTKKRQSFRPAERSTLCLFLKLPAFDAGSRIYRPVQGKTAFLLLRLPVFLIPDLCIAGCTDAKTRQYPDFGSLPYSSFVRGLQKYGSPSQLRDSAGITPDFPFKSGLPPDTWFRMKLCKNINILLFCLELGSFYSSFDLNDNICG